MKTSIGKSNLNKYGSYEDWQTPADSVFAFFIQCFVSAFGVSSSIRNNFEKKENITSRIGQTKVAHTGVIYSHPVGTKTKLTTNCA